MADSRIAQFQFLDENAEVIGRPFEGSLADNAILKEGAVVGWKGVGQLKFDDSDRPFLDEILADHSDKSHPPILVRRWDSQRSIGQIDDYGYPTKASHTLMLELTGGPFER